MEGRREIEIGSSPRSWMTAVVLVLMVCALTAGSRATADDASVDRLQPAISWSAPASSLHEPVEGAWVRVRAVLVDQRLTKRALAMSERSSSGRSPAPRSPSPSGARPDPTRLSADELALGTLLERRRNRRIDRLSHSAAAQSRSLDAVEADIRSLGGSVISRELVPASILARIPGGRVDDVSHVTGVAYVVREQRQTPLLDVSHEAVGATSWWSAGHTGGAGAQDVTSADVAILSEAVDPEHPAFASVQVMNQAGLTPGDHGTHTGGIIVSSDGVYRGMAAGAERLVGVATTASALALSEDAPASGDPAEVVNYSFGSPAISDGESVAGDVVIAAFDLGRAEAAGNEHVPGAGPTVNNIGRNTLSVGAYADIGTVTSSDDVVADFSSRGPSPGGRKKPDLTAPGVSIMAPSALWDEPIGNPLFTPESGTSFSTPHVAGAMTLLAGAGILDPKVQRAILINSARDWDGLISGLNNWTVQTGWRPEVGWGALDLTRALAERGNYEAGEVRGGEAAYFRAPGLDAGDKSTLAFELRGYWPDYPQPGSAPLVYTQSNLDLRQYHESGEEVPPPEEFVPLPPGQTAGPDAVDPNDTVEQVRAPAGAGDMILKVEAASSVEGLDAEPFAITSAVPLQPLARPEVKPSGVHLSQAGPVRCGAAVTVTARASNPSSDLDVGGAQLSIELPDGLELASGLVVQEVDGGALGAGAESDELSWVVKPNRSGKHPIRISGHGLAYGTGIDRTSAPAFVNADCGAPKTTLTSGPSGTTSNASPSFAFSSSEGGGFRCALDGAPLVGCSSPRTYSRLPDGRHTFRVLAVDTAGNVDPTPATRSFTVDTVVAGAVASVRSGRIKARKKIAGAINVGLAEQGSATIVGKITWRGGSAVFKQRKLALEPGVIRRVNQKLRAKPARRVARAVDKGRNVVVLLTITFEDALGNREQRTLGYRLR